MTFNINETNVRQADFIVINTIEDFEKVMPVSVELPSIDLSAYTIVLGQYTMPLPQYVFKKQAIVVGAETLTVNLLFEQIKDGAFPQVTETYYFWGLYPKLPNLPIREKVVIY